MPETPAAPATTIHSSVPLPHRLDVKGNLTQNWKRWKQVWDSYEIVTNLKDKETAYRTATFITCIGPDALEVYNGLPFENAADKNDIVKVLDLMEKHCLGVTNTIYERYVFNNRLQKPGETIDEYCTQLKGLSQTCEFGELKDDLIRDRIVCGITDDGVRKRLLQTAKLTLKTCMDTCRASETTSQQLKAMKTSGDYVHKISHKSAQRSHHHKKYDKQERKSGHSHYSEGKSKHGASHSLLKFDCKYCGSKHEMDRDKCPAINAKCRSCDRIGHYSKKCRFRDSSSRKPRRYVRALVDDECEDTSSDTESDEDILQVTSSKSEPQRKIFAKMLVGTNSECSVRFQVDSGATCNVISALDLPLGTQLKPTNTQLTAYGSTKIKTKGKCTLKLKNPKNSQKYRTEFIVVEGKAVPIIGSKTAQKMQLIEIRHDNIAALDSNQGLTKEDLKTKFPRVFDGGLGKFKGEPQHLEIDANIPPVKQYVRKVPIALKDSLQQELQRLEELEVICKVEEPTDWVSSLVAVKKPNGTLRLCIDPKPLNCALKRSHYPLPVVDDLLPKLSNVKVYSVLDVKNGYWHVELDKKSSLLTTMGTCFGRYRWLRLPFGIKPASELFQRHLDQVINGAKGVELIADDMLITGEGDTLEEAIANHDQNILDLLQKCDDNNVKLNWDKLKFKQPQVDFSGHLFTTKGLKADPKKIAAITEMPTPTDVQGVQRIIGMINYLSRFLKGLSDVCEPLRTLTKKDAHWEWTTDHDEAFAKLKLLVTQAPVLKYFDTKLPTTIQCDASETGLGATLMQVGQPVAYASRALTSAERNYAQIEKELLAIVFSAKKFHQYTYGRKVTVESDHRPLESIQKKSLLAAPKRLQRMLLALQEYDLEIQYKPGKEMYLADTLSRAYIQPKDRDSVLQLAETTKMSDYTPISSATLDEIRHATSQDENLQQLKATILRGWPDTRRDVQPSCSPYFNMRDELSVEDNIIYRGQQQCLVPLSMRKDILNRLHQPHDGIEGCRRRARDCVYWPAINSEIADMISVCEPCNNSRRKQTKETLHSHDIPNLPWTKLGTDLFSISEKNYLVTVDYYSDFFELDELKSKSAPEVIEKLKHHMSRHGIPNEMICDNVPFNAREFKEFSRQYKFKITPITPGHSQSNGKVESAVKIAKKLLKRATKTGNDVHLALLLIRNTPTEGMATSPAQRLFQRRTRTLLPMKTSKLQPHVESDVVKKKKKRQEKQANLYNRTAKDLRKLREGETVRVQSIRPHKTEWRKAKVNKSSGIRAYDVTLEDGTKLRRNRKHLIATPETFTDKTIDGDTIALVPENNQYHSGTAPTNHANATCVTHSAPVTATIANATASMNTPAVSRSGRILTQSTRLRDFHVYK